MSVRNIKVPSSIYAFMFAVFFAATAFAVSAATENKIYKWRYKITVSVDTPDGIKTGSAVRETTVVVSPYPLDTKRPYRTKISTKGEAAVVDLGTRGVMFALVDVDDHWLVFQAFPSPDPPLTSAGIEFYAKLPVGSESVLSPQRPPGYPKLVTFSDPLDPSSVTPVQVWERNKLGCFDLKEDRIEKYFGSGISLRNISVSIVSDDLTTGVDKYLPKDFNEQIIERWRELSADTQKRLYNLTGFKHMGAL